MSTLAPPIRLDEIARTVGAGAHLVPLRIEQYHEMIRTGILPEGSPIELVDGLLVVKDRSQRGQPLMSIGPLHAAAVQMLAKLIAPLAAAGFDLRTQSPVSLPPYGEPEPDGAIVRGPASRFVAQHPTAADVACVIEVADSSLEYDRSTKLRTYARNGIAQYVIVNLIDRVLEVHDQPNMESGTYATRYVIDAAGVVTLALFDGKTLDVPAASLLPQIVG